MIAVIFEARPHADRTLAYLDAAECSFSSSCRS